MTRSNPCQRETRSGARTSPGPPPCQSRDVPRGRWSLDRRDLPDGPGSRRNRRPSGVLAGFHLTPTAASDNLQHWAWNGRADSRIPRRGAASAGPVLARFRLARHSALDNLQERAGEGGPPPPRDWRCGTGGRPGVRSGWHRWSRPRLASALGRSGEGWWRRLVWGWLR
jgi:hypothetical protein